MPTGRSDCDSTSPATFLVVAPSAMRTPISFACCSTTYDRTLNRPDTVNTSASPPKYDRDPEGDLQHVRLHSGHRSQRHDVAEAGIDAREAFEQRLARLLGVAADAQVQRRLRALGTGRQVHARRRSRPGSRTTPTTVNVRDGSTVARALRRRRRRPATPMAEPRGAPPARRRRHSARAGARWSRTRSRRPPPRCVPPA